MNQSQNNDFLSKNTVCQKDLALSEQLNMPKSEGTAIALNSNVAYNSIHLHISV